MFSYINGYSGQSIYDDFFITFYNLAFTAFPLGAKAVWDQDINPVTDGAEYRKFMPKLYYVGQKSTIFNWTNYFIWVIYGVAHAVIVFTIPYFIFKDSIWQESGTTADIWIFSVTSFTSLFCVRIPFPLTL
jgi:magnesium-transporting ATPase (P-type)